MPAIQYQPSLTVSIFGHRQRISTVGFSLTRATHSFSIKILISPVTNSDSSLADLLLFNSIEEGFVLNGILYPVFIISNIVLPVPIFSHSL